MDLETQLYVSVGVLGGVGLLLMVLVTVLFSQLRQLRKQLEDLQSSNRLRVQKLKIQQDKNHAFHNPTISPDEELSKRGYSMYMGSEEDLESGRGAERQTGGQFIENLTREIESRQQRQSAPPFLLQAIEDNKRKSRSLSSANPMTQASRGRASETNPNFIY